MGGLHATFQDFPPHPHHRLGLEGALSYDILKILFSLGSNKMLPSLGGKAILYFLSQIKTTFWARLWPLRMDKMLIPFH